MQLTEQQYAFYKFSKDFFLIFHSEQFDLFNRKPTYFHIKDLTLLTAQRPNKHLKNKWSQAYCAGTPYITGNSNVGIFQNNVLKILELSLGEKPFG